MTEPGKTDTVVPEKVDPETLVLRAKPRRAIRIKRNVLIAAAGIGAVVLCALVWLGLEPSLIRPVVGADQSKDPEKHKAAMPDQVAALPKSYADVPKLGQPLPGDLGKPLLEHQRSEAAKGAGGSVRYDGASPAQSGLFFQVGSVDLARVKDTGVAVAAPASLVAGTPAAPIDAKVAFLETASRAGRVDAHAIQSSVGRSVVLAGTVISASLITGLNSDLPGTVLAQVTSDVRDSVSGSQILIPQGTRLIGKYDSSLSFRQSRVLVVWQRLIWPDGRSLEIDNLPASDLAGYAGLSDRVSYHTASVLKGIGLSTLVGAASALHDDSDSDLVKALRQSAAETANQGGQKVVSRYLDVQPTVDVRPGWPIRVIVQKDLVTAPSWGGIE